MNKHYTYKNAGGANNLYAFVTDNSITYEVKFKPSDYIFEGRTEFYIPTFELSITVAVNETGKNPPLDSKISFTIAEIFKDVIENGKQLVFIDQFKLVFKQTPRKGWQLKGQDLEYCRIKENNMVICLSYLFYVKMYKQLTMSFIFPA